MSYARPAASARRRVAALVLCLTLITLTGQRMLTAAASSIGHLYAAAVTTAVVHHSPDTTGPVSPAHSERSSR